MGEFKAAFSLQKKRINSNLIQPFGERPAPLGWSEVVPLFFLSEQRGTTGTRRRICPYDVVIISTPMYEKKHWDGDLADLTGQCVKVGHELFEIFERFGQIQFHLLTLKYNDDSSFQI